MGNKGEGEQWPVQDFLKMIKTPVQNVWAEVMLCGSHNMKKSSAGIFYVSTDCTTGSKLVSQG